MIGHVCWLVRSIVTFVVISRKVKIRLSRNLVTTFNVLRQIPLFTFQRSRSTFKVKTAVLKIFTSPHLSNLSNHPQRITTFSRPATARASDSTRSIRRTLCALQILLLIDWLIPLAVAWPRGLRCIHQVWQSARSNSGTKYDFRQDSRWPSGGGCTLWVLFSHLLFLLQVKWKFYVGERTKKWCDIPRCRWEEEASVDLSAAVLQYKHKHS